MSNRSLPKPLGLRRITPQDVVFDHYLSSDERYERVEAAFDWVSRRLQLFMPLSPPQEASLRRIWAALKACDAIAAEVAIAELILLEEPIGATRDKFGRLIERGVGEQ
jgi:hypothetical protein